MLRPQLFVLKDNWETIVYVYSIQYYYVQYMFANNMQVLDKSFRCCIPQEKMLMKKYSF